MIDRATTATNRPHPLVQAIHAALESRAITQTTAAAGLALLLAVPMAGSAADFTVANRNDAGPGSLRQAVLNANACPGPDTILFDSSVTGTIVPTSGALTVIAPLTIVGGTLSIKDSTFPATAAIASSSADNLVPGDTNDSVDIFVHDRETGVTERVSLDSNGTQGNGYSTTPAISGDGRFVAFFSEANNPERPT